jgi:enolase-phosphatase E1
MTPSGPGAILTDVEGTTSSITFVRDVLFPYARRAMPVFVAQHWRDPAVRPCLDQVQAELGAPADLGTVVATLDSWIDSDRKHPALKELQGLIWQAGYLNHDYLAHVYPDAVKQLRQWHARGHPIYVFSSGSVLAQRLFFRHSQEGDLSAMFSGHFDTGVGSKRAPASYRRIARFMQRSPADVLFLSDVVEELDGAREAGLATVLVDRPSDYPVARSAGDLHGHRRIQSLEEVCLVK